MLNNMKKRNIAVVLMSLVFACTACDQQLDINVDPSYPGDASVEMLLPSAITWSSSRLGGDIQLIGSFWCQYYSQANVSNQYIDLSTYTLSNSDYNGVWNDIYSGALADCKQIVKKSEAEKKWDYYVIAKILTAFNYHILVDLYGSVPFTESNLGVEKIAPKYDDGKVVNAGIIELLDQAIAKRADAVASAAASNPLMGNKDFVYAGNIDRWIEFAKSLKIKILMRDFNANKESIGKLIAAGGLLTVDARMNGFKNSEYNSNPLYESDRRKLNTTNNLSGTKTIIDFLKLNKDPRLTDYFEPAVDKDNINDVSFFNGIPFGNTSLTTDEYPIGYTSRAKLAAEDPVYYMSIAEFNFILAEYYARSTDVVNAKKYYDKGVASAFERWNHDASDFTKVGGVYEFKPADMLKCIMTQKWVASVRSQAWDSFFDINRTGYPKLGTVQTTEPDYVSGELVPALNGVLRQGELPRRLLTPKSSVDYNPNAPKALPITTKMWWHL
jgi:hypothetical protein